MALRAGPNNAAFVHLTYVPWIAAAGELKTKPTQHTVQKMREIGIQPDVLLCRADREIPDEERDKISLFTNVRADRRDLDVGRGHDLQGAAQLHEQRLDELICMKLQLLTKSRRSEALGQLVYEVEHPQHEVRIAMCGKYTDLSDSYKSLNEALRHAGIHNHARVKIEYVDSESLTVDNIDQLASFDAILVPGGFGKRGVEGKILTAQYAREHRIPYLGICLGMQVATIEVARHLAGLTDANSTEFDPQTPHPVIALIEEWQDRDGTIQKRDANSDLAHHASGCAKLRRDAGHAGVPDLWQGRHGTPSPPLRGERALLDRLREAGLVISAITQREKLTEIVELPQSQHPWFVGVQFHPEFKSTPWDGHPLFTSFVKAALEHQREALVEKVAA